MAGNAPPIIAKLRRCFDGKDGRQLKVDLEAARARVAGARAKVVDVGQRTAAALAYARDNCLTPPDTYGRLDDDTADDPTSTREWSW